MRGLALASLTFAAFLVAGGRSTSAPAAGATIDPPILVPWDRIGNIALGEPRARVQQNYDAQGYSYHVLGRQDGIIQGYYWLHRSRVFVTFQDGPVNEIDFTTRYYRTKNGFGIGSRIRSARVTGPLATSASIAGMVSSGTLGCERRRAAAGSKSVSAGGHFPQKPRTSGSHGSSSTLAAAELPVSTLR
jgi:hypothetical protein